MAVFTGADIASGIGGETSILCVGVDIGEGMSVSAGSSTGENDEARSVTPGSESTTCGATNT